jgi:hypothetical protein
MSSETLLAAHSIVAWSLANFCRVVGIKTLTAIDLVNYRVLWARGLEPIVNYCGFWVVGF